MATPATTGETAATASAPAAAGTARTRRPSARRRRHHEATVEEIVKVARELLAEEGAAGVTISAVARRLQVVPSALYRYVASRDELLATLTADAFNGLAETLEVTVARLSPDDPLQGLRVAARAWRTWALEHPTDFGLVFGAPVPGFAGSEQAARAAERTGALFTRLLTQARAQAAAPPGPAREAGRATESTPAQRPSASAGVVPEVLHDDLVRIAGDPVTGALLVSGWVRLHGHLVAEMFGHLPPVDPAHRTELFELTIALMLREAALT